MNTVWVAGSINIDLIAQAGRFPRPGETVPGDCLQILPGGKGANQAVAAARLDARCVLLGCVGDDFFSETALSFLRCNNVDLTGVRKIAGQRTGCALITVAGGENTIVVTPGANCALSGDDVAAQPYAPQDVLVAQLETPADATAAFFCAGRARGAVTLLNGAPATEEGRSVLPLADCLILNESELAFYARCEETPRGAALEQAMRGVRTTATQKVIVTLGKAGAMALEGDKIWHVPAQRAEVVDTTGAGDSFTGAIAARLVAGDELSAALRYANAAASLTVQKPGAGPAMPYASAVEAVLAGAALQR